APVPGQLAERTVETACGQGKRGRNAGHRLTRRQPHPPLMVLVGGTEYREIRGPFPFADLPPPRAAVLDLPGHRLLARRGDQRAHRQVPSAGPASPAGARETAARVVFVVRAPDVDEQVPQWSMLPASLGEPLVVRPPRFAPGNAESIVDK